ncbi:MAG: hypothetical protein JOZ07_03550 [Solirubrobacterales bacterium]|nr:hypothetical protein [Solirubrobacterales bacterium]
MNQQPSPALTVAAPARSTIPAIDMQGVALGTLVVAISAQPGLAAAEDATAA